MKDVPYLGLIDEEQRRPLVQATCLLPSGRGLYAWWPGQEQHGPAQSVPLFIGSSRNLVRAVKTDRTDSKDSPFRRRLAAMLHEQDLHSFRFYTPRRILDPHGEAQLSQWMQLNLLLSWSRVEDPEAYKRALVAALAPPLNAASPDRRRGC